MGESGNGGIHLKTVVQAKNGGAGIYRCSGQDGVCMSIPSLGYAPVQLQAHHNPGDRNHNRKRFPFRGSHVPRMRGTSVAIAARLHGHDQTVGH